MTRKDRRFAIGTIVKHFKGKLYRIEGFARQTESNELLVFFREMEPPFYCYATPEGVFCSTVDSEKYPELSGTYRYEKVSIDEAVEAFNSRKSRLQSAQNAV